MALSYWIEAMLSLSNPAGTNTPGTLARQAGGEYLFPLIPPNFTVYFVTDIQAGIRLRALPIYMLVMYRVRFGYMVPGAFQLTLVTAGLTAYNGTLTGHFQEEGIDYLFFLEANSALVAYITNLTPMNQYFQMLSQYLIISSEADYVEFKRQLEKMHFPYALPEVR